MAAAGESARAKGYHHGDLRNALILAAAELIQESGSVDFAISEAARRAGVSTAAPYRHFKDKDELLEAVTTLGFMGLRVAMEEALVGQEDGTELAVMALGRAYIRFVLDHRPFYDLMWGDHGNRMVVSGEGNLTNTGFGILAGQVAAVCEREQIAGVDPIDLAIKLWAMTHGLASLSMSQRLQYFAPDIDVFATLDGSTHIFFDGLRRSQPD